MSRWLVMTTYIALLRAVNVGGTGKLPMADLKALCTKLGFRGVETYIASGNVVFDSDMTMAKVQEQLKQGLLSYAGKELGLFVRTAAQMQGVLSSNPFADKEPRFTCAIFLDEKPPVDTVTACRGRTREELHLGRREIYVYYPAGIGQSRLQIPAARSGTARNMNTVAKLVEMSARR
jgi:uncharacterized protein (DUF1697 family)